MDIFCVCAAECAPHSRALLDTPDPRWPREEGPQPEPAERPGPSLREPPGVTGVSPSNFGNATLPSVGENLRCAAIGRPADWCNALLAGTWRQHSFITAGGAVLPLKSPFPCTVDWSQMLPLQKPFCTMAVIILSLSKPPKYCSDWRLHIPTSLDFISFFLQFKWVRRSARRCPLCSRPPLIPLLTRVFEPEALCCGHMRTGSEGF